MTYITDNASQNFVEATDFSGMARATSGVASRKSAATAKVSAVRASLYSNTLFAPAPVHYGARAIGRALKLIGL